MVMIRLDNVAFFLKLNNNRCLIVFEFEGILALSYHIYYEKVQSNLAENEAEKAGEV